MKTKPSYESDVITTEDVSRHGLDILGWFRIKTESPSSNRIFRSTFGISSTVLSILWGKVKEMEEVKKDKNGLDHLMWSLMFMKVYSSETIHCTLLDSKVSEKVFRKWSWKYVRLVASLFPDLVSLYKMLIFTKCFCDIKPSSSLDTHGS